MNIFSKCRTTLLLAGLSMAMSSIVYAAPQSIEADGRYIMGASDTFEHAKAKALEDALRTASEKAGVYVESYSKTNNMALTADQVRIIAGSIIKIENKTFKTSANGEMVGITCHIAAVIDTDEINLKRAMEMKKTQEENKELTTQIQTLAVENVDLRKKYKEAQDESEKYKLRGEIMSNEMQLGNLYKESFKGKSIVEEIKFATSDIKNFGAIYPDMPENEFDRLGEQELLNKDWKKTTYVNGSRLFTKRIDDVFTEEFSYNPLFKNNMIFFKTPSKVAAEKVFKIAFSNIYSIQGAPTTVWDNENNVIWQVEEAPGKFIQLQICEVMSSDEYMIRISKEIRNQNAKKHSQVNDMKMVLSNLEAVAGDWYNESGNKVLSVKNGTINDCKVTNGFDFAGGRGQYGVYRIMQNNGPRDITIKKMNSNMIQIDGKTVLYKTSTVPYYESVCGVYLGMSYNAIVGAIGSPDAVTNTSNRKTLVYNGTGLKIQLENDVAVQIIMLNNGRWFLKRSGLNYRNSLEDYYATYHLNRMPKTLTTEERRKGYIGGAYRIAAGEYLWFDYYPERLVLSIYSN